MRGGQAGKRFERVDELGPEAVAVLRDERVVTTLFGDGEIALDRVSTVSTVARIAFASAPQKTSRSSSSCARASSIRPSVSNAQSTNVPHGDFVSVHHATTSSAPASGSQWSMRQTPGPQPSSAIALVNPRRRRLVDQLREPSGGAGVGASCQVELHAGQRELCVQPGVETAGDAVEDLLRLVEPSARPRRVLARAVHDDDRAGWRTVRHLRGVGVARVPLAADEE